MSRPNYFLLAVLIFVACRGQSEVFSQAFEDSCEELATDGMEAPDFDFTQYVEIPDIDYNQGDQLEIGTITHHQMPVFNLDDPAENNWLFRTANKLHIMTKPATLDAQLLFEQGAPYAKKKLQESERILRQKKYLYDARIIPRRRCGNRVDVNVFTRDIWTLTLSFNFTRQGGKNTTDFTIRETNFLGLGKYILLRKESDVERDGVKIHYRDPHLFGSHVKGTIKYEDNDDGKLKFFQLHLPFYSIDSEWSAGLTSNDVRQLDTLYELGDDIAKFEHRIDRQSAFIGFPMLLRREHVHRMLVGVHSEQHRFSIDPNERSPQKLPDNREINYPWIGYQREEDAHSIVRNRAFIQRTEDLYVGQRLDVRAGWASKSYGSDVDRAVFKFVYTDTLFDWQEQTLVFNSTADAYWNREKDKVEDLLFSNVLRYQYQRHKKISNFARLSAHYSKNLPRDKQLLLGGEFDLRGYPLYFQEGDRRVTLTLEQRYYSDWHLFKLIRVGAAAFIDVGRAWFSDRELSNDGTLADIGFGLRLSSSRAEKGKVLHIDIAVPLTERDEIDKFQLLVTTKANF